MRIIRGATEPVAGECTKVCATCGAIFVWSEDESHWTYDQRDGGETCSVKCPACGSASSEFRQKKLYTSAATCAENEEK